ncbi:MAG TPA: hypothetical protein VGX27_04535 [Candidatus Dormibacteraeota bacterium]|nr:hypothetical protein [Candidatus Dormibacteraeota bacterium]
MTADSGACSSGWMPRAARNSGKLSGSVPGSRTNISGSRRARNTASTSSMTSSASSGRHRIHEALFGPAIGKSG